MIKSLTINLTGPICLCDEQSLAWSWPREEFRISCETCKAAVTLPRDRVRAGFNLDRKYPGIQEPPKRPRLTPLEGGKGKGAE